GDRASRTLAGLERREALTRQGCFFGLREVGDQILQALLGDRGLLELKERQCFLVERGRRLLAARVIRDHFPELLHGQLHLRSDLVVLPAVGVATRDAEVRLADPVLCVAGEWMIGEAPDELTESGHRQRVAALAEVDVGGLVDVLRLRRVRGRSRSGREGRRGGRGPRRFWARPPRAPRGR